MSKNVPAYMFTIKSMRVRGSDEQSEQLYIYQGVYIYIYIGEGVTTLDVTQEYIEARL